MKKYAILFAALAVVGLSACEKKEAPAAAAPGAAAPAEAPAAAPAPAPAEPAKK